MNVLARSRCDTIFSSGLLSARIPPPHGREFFGQELGFRFSGSRSEAFTKSVGRVKARFDLVSKNQQLQLVGIRIKIPTNLEKTKNASYVG